MKKLISLALTLAILASLAISVSAAETDHAVGKRGETNTVEDGVANFTSSKQYVMDIKVNTGDVQSRYAVDVEYDVMSLTISGSNMIWNVNTLEYDVATDDATTPTDTWFGVTVKNYSDKPVVVEAAITDQDANDFIEVGFVPEKDSNDVDDDDNLLDTLEGAVDKTAETVDKMSFAIRVHGNAWANALTYYKDLLNAGTTSKTIAQCTLTISKPTVTP